MNENVEPPNVGGGGDESLPTVRINMNDKSKKKKSGGHATSSATGGGGGPRRIVKAAHPKAASNGNGTAAAESRQKPNGTLKAPSDKDKKNDDDDADNDDELIAKNKHPHHNHRPDPHFLLLRPTGGADSPVLREACQEAAQQVKREQVRSSSDRRKVKSENVKNVMRHHPQQPPQSHAPDDATNGSSNGKDTHQLPTPRRGAVPAVKANPFSRFLSAFSVEPAHPEHKRRLLHPKPGSTNAGGGVGGEEEGASPNPPAVKKARTKDDDDDSDYVDDNSVFVGNVDETKATTVTTTTPRSVAAADGTSTDKASVGAAWWTSVRTLFSHHLRNRPVLVSAVAVAATAATLVAWRNFHRPSGGRVSTSYSFST